MWLVGMMGSGKTTAGRVAAVNLGVDFLDTDEVVAEQVGCSIGRFWRKNGEAAFRAVEAAATASLAVRAGVKVTGGGVVLHEDNRNILKGSSTVVWLTAEPETLGLRLETQENRPILTSDTRPRLEVLREMLDKRSHLYAEVATHQVPTDGLGIASVASALEEIWQS